MRWKEAVAEPEAKQLRRDAEASADPVKRRSPFQQLSECKTTNASPHQSGVRCNSNDANTLQLRKILHPVVLKHQIGNHLTSWLESALHFLYHFRRKTSFNRNMQRTYCFPVHADTKSEMVRHIQENCDIRRAISVVSKHINAEEFTQNLFRKCILIQLLKFHFARRNRTNVLIAQLCGLRIQKKHIVQPFLYRVAFAVTNRLFHVHFLQFHIRIRLKILQKSD